MKEVRFEVFMAVKIQDKVFWVMMLQCCSRITFQRTLLPQSSGLTWRHGGSTCKTEKMEEYYFDEY